MIYPIPIKRLKYQMYSRPTKRNNPKKNEELILHADIDPIFIAIN